MLYLNENHINEIGIEWNTTVDVIESTVNIMKTADYAQPIKPYLRYKNMTNRIIAMPAYIGKNINMAGIKWIASFPDNINKGLARANSVVILNDANTGVPVSVINTALISIIRTASVSGAILRKYMKHNSNYSYRIGIIGFGPIGQNHLKMCCEILKGKINQVFIYDLNSKPDLSAICRIDDIDILVCKNWQTVYDNADILITSTASSCRYIDKKAKKGMLSLHVSLRDFKLDSLKSFSKPILVDDWEEVNREDTDIELMSSSHALEQKDTLNIINIICDNAFSIYDKNSAIMFAPMGMGVFDIAMASYYYNKASESKVGQNLD